MMSQLQISMRMKMMQNQMMQNQMMQNQIMQNQIMQNQIMQNQIMQNLELAKKIQNQANDNQKNQSDPKSNIIDNQGIRVIFRVSSNNVQGGNKNASAPCIISCKFNEKLSDVVKRYKEKVKDNDESTKFIYNAKNLNLDLTVDEAGLVDNANIFVISTRHVQGAYQSIF